MNRHKTILTLFIIATFNIAKDHKLRVKTRNLYSKKFLSTLDNYCDYFGFYLIHKPHLQFYKATNFHLIVVRKHS